MYWNFFNYGIDGNNHIDTVDYLAVLFMGWDIPSKSGYLPDKVALLFSVFFIYLH